MSVKDLPLASILMNDYGNKKKWIDRLLSAKTKACSSLDPGFDRLDGFVSIYLEGVNYRIDGHILKVLDLPDIPVADLEYSVGELIESCIHALIDESSEYGARCFWPKWLSSGATA